MQYRSAAPRNTRSLAESLLRGFDEADTMEKLSEQREQESMVEEEGVRLTSWYTLIGGGFRCHLIPPTKM